MLRKIKLAAVLTTALAATVLNGAGSAHAATGETPGTYSPWSAPGDASWFTMPMNLEHDPGDYNAYWSTQFSFTGSASGYLGFQTHADGNGMFLVSVWNGTSATPGDHGSYCSDFSEGGTGKTCRNDSRPVAGHQYELSGVRQDDGRWQFLSKDLTAGTTVVLGTIGFAGGNAISAGSFDSWTEYFDWNNPATRCSDAKYSKLLFGVPRTSAGTGTYGTPSKSSTCQNLAKVTLSGAGALHEDGIGQ
ncbi:DUF3472 domain-containing protein [Amycolatopsis sp. PS_44_ISF1]|uniref:DUF3472 domain-containing protein n=1 Tax=Amycolatopsis sp. PS_44_ISF1 TaxID=2974917 RepID=UPI0028DEC1D0|nr:hypothetical protein [Amycolatopsis sp. PS_44_ISF1]MDT8912581.1 hypothetical protein [Amycolatopsis sp. PS_44_ISF1]